MDLAYAEPLYERSPGDVFRPNLVRGGQNSASIQAALNAAGANGGGAVWIAPGIWSIGSSLYLPDNVCLKGAGVTASVLMVDGPVRAAVVAGARAGSDGEGWSIESLTIDGGADEGFSRGAEIGFSVESSASYGIIRAVRVTNVRLDAIAITGAVFQNLFVEGISTDHIGRTGLFISALTASSGLFISEVSIGSFGGAFQTIHCPAVHLNARCFLSQIHIERIGTTQTGVLFGRGSDYSTLIGCHAALDGGLAYMVEPRIEGLSFAAEALVP